MRWLILAFLVAGPAAREIRAQTAPVQLLVIHARVLDVRTGRAAPRQTVIIDKGVITHVLSDSAARASGVRSRDTLDARGRLLTPGFVDAHFHTGMVLGDSITPTGGYITRLSPSADSARAYRRRVAAEFLPYGVTLVCDLGSDTTNYRLLRDWMTRSPDAPDFLTTGAALVSPESGRVIPPFQVAVRDSAEAAATVRALAGAGFRNVKLYWRLLEPAFRGGIAEANRLGMNTTAHVDYQNVTIDRAILLGVRHFEHAFTIAMSVLDRGELEDAVESTADLLGETVATVGKHPGAGISYIGEQWRILGDDDRRVSALIERLRATGSTLTPTLHVIAKNLGLSISETVPAGLFDDTRAFTPAQRARALEGYRIHARWVAEMDARGVHLAVGSDTPRPGRGVLDEILLLHAAGIAPWRVFRIATLYSAEAVGAGQEYGAVEVGRRANLLLFDSDPLVYMRAILGAKTVVKDGAIVRVTR
jgi:hypothetical protein